MTYIILFITCAVSILCFYDSKWFDRLSLIPYRMHRNREWYRVITHGFVHADWMHLIINMFVLWSFGTYIEAFLNTQEFIGAIVNGKLYFALLYFGGMIAASAYDIFKKKNNPYYSSIGASGAVSAVVFMAIFINPLGLIYVWFIPMPSILFGVLYMGFEFYSARRKVKTDNINHLAHMGGALYGFIFPLLISPQLIHLFINGFSR